MSFLKKSSESLFPLVNIYEDHDYFYFYIYLPDHNCATLKIICHHSEVIFTGKLTLPKAPKALYKEVYSTPIYRKFTLPSPIIEKVIATVHTEIGREYVIKKASSIHT